MFEKCRRYDLVNKLCQAQGKYEEAIEIALDIDRIHLRNTYYNYGKQKERVGDMNKAIELYEKANCRREIPRILMQHPIALQVSFRP